MRDLQQTMIKSDEAFEEIRRDRQANHEVIDAFHRAFYASRHTWGLTFFENVPVLKSPLDLWVYQEIIWDLKPTLLIETGTAYGGSALYFARQFDRLGVGHVLTIDLEPHVTLPQHDRISYVRGYSSIHDGVVDKVTEIAAGHPRVMVVLDSDHGARHVEAELDAYAPMVTNGQFLVVEDTNLNGRPIPMDWRGGPGPGPAVDVWLPRHQEFELAPLAERYMVTFNSWMRKIQ